MLRVSVMMIEALESSQRSQSTRDHSNEGVVGAKHAIKNFTAERLARTGA